MDRGAIFTGGLGRKQGDISMTRSGVQPDAGLADDPDAGMPVLRMRGLCPNNPLGFMAGLGSLRTLNDLNADAGWELRWSPECAEMRRRDGRLITEAGVAEDMERRLGHADSPLGLTYPMKGDKDKHVKGYEDFHRDLSRDVDIELEKRDTASARRLLDFAACIACSNPHSGKGPAKTTDKVVENQFRMVTGNATLFKSVSNIIERKGASTRSIRASLFEPWSYLDDGYSLNWDPTLTGRSHATSPSAPESAFNPSMYGANRIAFEALSLYPVIDDGWTIRTVGWSGKKFTWPVWNAFAGLDEVRGILSTKYDDFKPDERAQMGITLYSSEKINIDAGGKQKRLTPARLV